MAETARDSLNLPARVGWWLARQPVRVVVWLIIASIILTMWFYWQAGHFDDKQEILAHIKHNWIAAEIKDNLAHLLTPAQYEFARNHIVSVVLSLAASAHDYVYLWTSGNESAALLSTLWVYALIFATLRMGTSMFVLLTALPIMYVCLVWGRYAFTTAWRETQVASPSGTWFAVAWGSRSAIPWLIFSFLVLPVWDASFYALILIGTVAVQSYVMGRTFTDHL